MASVTQSLRECLREAQAKVARLESENAQLRANNSYLTETLGRMEIQAAYNAQESAANYRRAKELTEQLRRLGSLLRPLEASGVMEAAGNGTPGGGVLPQEI